MKKIVGLLFALSCFVTSFTSGGLLGVGTWFWVIIAAGVFVAVSQFLPALQGLGAVVASLAAVLSVLAVAFGLVAATIGGSFRLNDSESLLLFSFFLMAVFGVILFGLNRKPKAAG